MRSARLLALIFSIFMQLNMIASFWLTDSTLFQPLAPVQVSAPTIIKTEGEIEKVRPSDNFETISKSDWLRVDSTKQQVSSSLRRFLHTRHGALAGWPGQTVSRCAGQSNRMLAQVDLLLYWGTTYASLGVSFRFCVPAQQSADVMVSASSYLWIWDKQIQRLAGLA